MLIIISSKSVVVQHCSAIKTYCTSLSPLLSPQKKKKNVFKLFKFMYKFYKQKLLDSTKTQ